MVLNSSDNNPSTPEPQAFAIVPGEDHLSTILGRTQNAVAGAMSIKVGDGSPEMLPVAELARLINTLPYNEYRVLEALLQRMRKGEAVLPTHPEDLSQPGSPLYNVCEKLIALPKQPGMSMTTFGGDALLLTRTSYPAGKNVVNVTFQNENDRVALDATQSALIQCSRTVIVYSPHEQGGQIEIEGRTHLLSDGEWIILGRPLEFSRLFNRALGQTIKVPVVGEVRGDPGLSRGGIMVFLKGSKLFVFDRGSLNPITCRQGSFVVHYDPGAMSRDGVGFGNSVQNVAELEEPLHPEIPA